MYSVLTGRFPTRFFGLAELGEEQHKQVSVTLESFTAASILENFPWEQRLETKHEVISSSPLLSTMAQFHLLKSKGLGVPLTLFVLIWHNMVKKIRYFILALRFHCSQDEYDEGQRI